MIVCPECGAQHYPGTLFCDGCGAAVHPEARAFLEASQAAAGRQSSIRKIDERRRDASPTPTEATGGDIPSAAASPSMPPPLRVRVIQYEADLILRGTQFNIGRTDPFSDFVPEFDVTRFEGQERGVSRRHATIRWDGGGFVIRDNDSSNGTWLNGERLEPGREYPLPATAGVRFGGLLVQLTIAD